MIGRSSHDGLRCLLRRERGRVSQPLTPITVVASGTRHIRTAMPDSQQYGCALFAIIPENEDFARSGTYDGPRHWFGCPAFTSTFAKRAISPLMKKGQNSLMLLQRGKKPY